MSTRATVTINTPEDRDQIARWARNVEPGTVVTFRKKSRSTEQSAKMWAMLNEVSEQVEWYGQKLDADDWKDMFTASLRHARVVPGIDKGTFVPLGMRTSTMTIDEMSNLIELVYAFGAEHSVVFKEPREANDNPNTGDSSTPVSADGSPASAEDGGEIPAQSPSSPSLSPSDRGLLIECCAKFMEITVDEDLETPQAKRGVLESAKNMWKDRLRPELHDHLKGIFLSADAIIKGEADRAKAIAEFSYFLECAPEELGA